MAGKKIAPDQGAKGLYSSVPMDEDEAALEIGGTDRSNGTSRTKKSESYDDDDGVCADGAAAYISRTMNELVLGSSMNVLLLCTPVAIFSKMTGGSEVVTFLTSLGALVPFAERVSFVTEDVAKYTNDTLGGLLNATFGNITELIVCIFALKAGLLRIVQVSMLGSVLSNLLLVLGSALLLGGIKHPKQTFKQVASMTNSAMLMLAVLSMVLPTLLYATHNGAGGAHVVNTVTNSSVATAVAGAPAVAGYLFNASLGSSLAAASAVLASPAQTLPPMPARSQPAYLQARSLPGGDDPLWLSRFIAVLMLVMYFLYLLFQLKTHSYEFEGDDDDEEEAGLLGFWGGIFWLSFITFFISILSNYIVSTIEGAATSLGVPVLFIGGIIVPIVGNAAEHAAALIFAYRDKMEIALGSAVGSAVQIAVMVIPLCVIIGWILGQPMTMNYHVFEVTVLAMSCFLGTVMLMDQQSHWFKGAILMSAYFMIAAGFWAHVDPSNLHVQ